MSAATQSKRRRIVVAMSGGVDSSVAAGLLAEKGHEVIGISLRLAPEPAPGMPRSSSGCCSIEDFQDAARVATAINVPHYVFDMREEFQRSVISPFVDEYLAGRTPSPCILCNREIKFSLLHKKAFELGADAVATGHYARIERDDAGYHLLCGHDRNKDQSYFLFEMGQRELETTLFPVGAMAKDEVREHAVRLGLPVAEKPDSQEICFVSDGRYAEFVRRAAPERVKAGQIRNENGDVVGTHEGVHGYTVGQRRGLGVSAANPLYVSAIDAETATVTVSERASLAADGLFATGATWVAGGPPDHRERVQARIRYRHDPVAATVVQKGQGTVEVVFDEPQYAVTPGQATVFYRDDEVVGGAWIERGIATAQSRDVLAEML